MIGQTVSRYRVVEKLGGGGMGVVYKAEEPHSAGLSRLSFSLRHWPGIRRLWNVFGERRVRRPR
jgi:hypothetical protein